MGTELEVIEQQMTPLLPRLSQALAGTMPVERLMRTVLTACSNNNDLLGCDRQSLFNAAMTFAVLGLEVDGISGQGYLVPFKKRVQPIIGYKGYNTLGARAGLSIGGAVVREGDEFDYEEGTNARIHFKRKIGDEESRKIIAVFSKAEAKSRPALIKILSIDEILAVKAKSQRGDKPPWSDPAIGFPAMAEKTAKRRLARDMPLTLFQYAARMEEANEEQGKLAWVGEDGVMVEGEVMPPRHSTETPTSDALINPPSIADKARSAARQGTDVLRTFCQSITKTDYASSVKPIIDELKDIANKSDTEEST